MCHSHAACMCHSHATPMCHSHATPLCHSHATPMCHSHATHRSQPCYTPITAMLHPCVTAMHATRMCHTPVTAMLHPCVTTMLHPCVTAMLPPCVTTTNISQLHVMSNLALVAQKRIINNQNLRWPRRSRVRSFASIIW